MMQEYILTIGDLAKKFNITVRTLQYYDQIGLLKPSIISEGGRRLYKGQDIVLLDQILTFKHLGFSLHDIKDKLIQINDPNDLVLILNKQEQILKEQIEKNQAFLASVSKIKEEIKDTQIVDWSKYTQMIKIVKQTDDFSWTIDFIDHEVFEQGSKLAQEKKDVEIGIKWQALSQRAIELVEEGVLPESFKGQTLAKEWWEMVTLFTGGDMSILEKLFKFHGTQDQWPDEMKEKQKKIDPFIGKALGFYIEKNNIQIPNIKKEE